MPYIIRVSSQKGGVGKTTVAVNLAVALQGLGHTVLLVDADTINPSIGFHMGLEGANIGFKSIVLGKARLGNVTAMHGPSGVHVIPGLINAKQFLLTHSQERRIDALLRATHYQFAIIDTEPGYTSLNKYIDKALIITTPDMPGCSSAVRLATAFDRLRVQHELIVNRVRNRKYEMPLGDIEELYERKVFGVLPEDDIVPESVEAHIPAYIMNSRTRFSRDMRALAQKVVSQGRKGGFLSASPRAAKASAPAKRREEERRTGKKRKGIGISSLFRKRARPRRR